ncbi:unnamed protein product [Prunus armeniaca]
MAPVDWRKGKRAHKTFFALPSQNMLGWENRGSSNPVPPVEVQKFPYTTVSSGHHFFGYRAS